MTPELLNQFAAIVGEKHVIRDMAGMAGYMTEWREIWVGKSPLVMRPGSTEEVSRILKLASETGTAIVPQSRALRDRMPKAVRSVWKAELP